MKKSVYLLLFMLCVAIVLTSFAGCIKRDEFSDLESFSINQNDISKYQIVYAAPDPKEVKWENYYFGIDYKYDEITAKELQALIFNVFGIELNVVCDTMSNVSEFEILIGKTNRESTENFDLDLISPDVGKCFVSKNCLIMCGGSYSSTFHCIEMLLNEFRKQAESGSKYVILDESFNKENVYSQKNVAVIGDDIFNYSSSTDTDVLGVPSVLQRLLWKDNKITSYLEGDSTVRSDLNRGTQYVATDSYKNLLENCSDLDIIIINLGTYDLLYSENKWDKTDDAMFISCYEGIIEEMHSLNPALKFYICTSVCVQDNKHVVNAQSRVYKSLLELDYDVSIIDLNSLYDEYLFKDSFINNIYPSELSSAIIAKRIAYDISDQ